MKKLLTVMFIGAMFCSCAVNQANIKTANVKAPILSATVASLKVEAKPITFSYEPNKTERKALSVDQLIENAQYLALQKHGSGDIMVQVSYNLDMKKGLIKKIKKVTITGYPATYVDFRVPTQEDRENIETFYNENTIKIVAPTPSIFKK